MPTYVLEDKETGEQQEVFMSFGEMQEYKKIHDLKQVVQAPNIVSGKLGGFKEVLQKVGEGHPGSVVDRQHNRRTAKQVATDKVAKKHGVKNV